MRLAFVAIVAATLSTAAITGTAFAHHGWEAYDAAKQQKVTGTIADLKWEQPHAVLWLTVNGVEKQRSNTRHMLFKVDHLIADISAGITLEPGDIIATGTPEGVGAGRTPQEWLWPGDVVVASVEGIGTIRHAVVNATP